MLYKTCLESLVEANIENNFQSPCILLNIVKVCIGLAYIITAMDNSTTFLFPRRFSPNFRLILLTTLTFYVIYTSLKPKFNQNRFF